VRQPRQRRLDQLAQDQDPAWADAERLINTKLPAHYDAAVTLLRDLQELAQREDQAQAFARRFTALREAHLRKPSLIARFRPGRAHALIRTPPENRFLVRNASAVGSRPAAVADGYSGFFDGAGELATCRVEEPVLGEWCLGWSIEHPGMDCLNQGPRVLS
jgi:hypothetical protein